MTRSISSVVCGVPPEFISTYHCSTSRSVFRSFTFNFIGCLFNIAKSVYSLKYDPNTLISLLINLQIAVNLCNPSTHTNSLYAPSGTNQYHDGQLKYMIFPLLPPLRKNSSHAICCSSVHTCPL